MPRNTNDKVYLVMLDGNVLKVFGSSSRAHTYRRNRNNDRQEGCVVVGPFNVE